MVGRTCNGLKAAITCKVALCVCHTPPCGCALWVRRYWVKQIKVIPHAQLTSSSDVRAICVWVECWSLAIIEIRRDYARQYSRHVNDGSYFGKPHWWRGQRVSTIWSEWLPPITLQGISAVLQVQVPSRSPGFNLSVPKVLYIRFIGFISACVGFSCKTSRSPSGVSYVVSGTISSFQFSCIFAKFLSSLPLKRKRACCVWGCLG